MADGTLQLAVIAAATVVMAFVQIGVAVFAVRIAGRVNRLVEVVEHEVKPTLARVDAVAADVKRVSGLASAQAQRLDALMGQLAGQADEVLAVAEDAVVSPVRRGGAFLAGLRAALLAFQRGAPPVKEAPVSETGR